VKEKNSMESTVIIPTLSLLLDNVVAAGNVGAIFRVADAVGIDRLYLTGFTPSPGLSIKADKVLEKVSRGHIRRIPYETHRDPLQLVRNLRKHGVNITALEHSDRSISYKKAEYGTPMCLILGCEEKGIQDSLLAEADQHIYLPMAGVGQSLNVAVAAAAALYEISNALSNVR
jgi:tRNA G18 (ribose-2'-O)-methylase SpoU